MSTLEIPGFEILDKIGAGGMATVWKARQVSLDRIVAIKVLYSKFARDPADIQRFQQEAQAAARLKHPGIVQVYDAQALGENYYFVMEYVAGYTVGEWLKRKGHLSVADGLLVAHAVADALAYAWGEAGIVHFDVKPDNVLVDADGSVKVTDLGLARTLSQISADAGSDEVMGTPEYMAPEQVMGQAGADFRVDVYALGAMLYHMVTGKVPFAGQPAETVMELQVTGTLPDPMDINPDVPAPVAGLIEKLMCKDPAGRAASWDEVRHDLDRVKKGLRPAGQALAKGASTVARTAARAKTMRGLGARRSGTSAAGGASTSTSWGRLAAILALGLGGLWLYSAGVRGRLKGYWEEPGEAAASSPAMAAEGDVWREDYQNAVSWTAANPGRYSEAIAMLERVATGAQGTTFGALARQRADILRRERQRSVETVLAQLEGAAAALVELGDHEGAARKFETYAGALAAETADRRQARAAELRAAGSAAPAEVKPQVEFEALLDQVAGNLRAGQLNDAVASVSGAMADPGHAGRAAELEDLKAQIEAALDAEQRILDSFVRQVGQRVSLKLRAGTRDVTIREVRDGRILAALNSGSSGGATHGRIEIDIDKLQYAERVGRLGGPQAPGAALYLGLMAIDAGAATTARKYLDQSVPLLAERLLAPGG